MTASETTLQGARVLVTGAGGFIGSHLVEALVHEGARVVAHVHYRSDGGWGLLKHVPQEILEHVDVRPGDVRDAEQLSRAAAGCDVIFHLAALIGIPYSYEAPRSYVETNVTGTLNVLEAARTHGVRRVVHTSTSECYGTAVSIPMQEDHPLSAQSPYAASKVAADMLAASYARSFECPVVTLRPFNTYGPRQSARAVIPTIIVQALCGDRVRLGATAPVRDLLYVEDTAAAFVAAACASDVVGEVLHVGSGVGLSVGDLANRILEQLGKPGVVVEREEQRLRPGASEVDRLVCNPSRAHELLGWAPTLDLDEGLERTIAYISEHLAEYRPEIYAR
jgi:NAD dependent epimerase/dehydratase